MFLMNIKKIVGNKTTNITELLDDFYNNIHNKVEIIDQKEYILAIQNNK